MWSDTSRLSKACPGHENTFSGVHERCVLADNQEAILRYSGNAQISLHIVDVCKLLRRSCPMLQVGAPGSLPATLTTLIFSWTATWHVHAWPLLLWTCAQQSQGWTTRARCDCKVRRQDGSPLHMLNGYLEPASSRQEECYAWAWRKLASAQLLKRLHTQLAIRQHTRLLQQFRYVRGEVLHCFCDEQPHMATMPSSWAAVSR